MDGQPEYLFKNQGSASLRRFVALLNRDPRPIHDTAVARNVVMTAAQVERHRKCSEEAMKQRRKLVRAELEIILRHSGVPLYPRRAALLQPLSLWTFEPPVTPSLKNIPLTRAGRSKPRVISRDTIEVEKNNQAWKAFNTDRSAARGKLAAIMQVIDEWRRLPLADLRAAINPFLWRCQDPRCSRFFLAPDGHARAYCSRKCAGRTTARKSMKTKWQNERVAKLRRVCKAITKWDRQGDWKAFVAAKAGVSKNWLTYAVNCGDLQQPKAPHIQSHTIPHRRP